MLDTLMNGVAFAIKHYVWSSTAYVIAQAIFGLAWHAGHCGLIIGLLPSWIVLAIVLFVIAVFVILKSSIG